MGLSTNTQGAFGNMSNLTVDCYRPGCYCTLDHQIALKKDGWDIDGRYRTTCPRCRHHRLVIGRLRGDLPKTVSHFTNGDNWEDCYFDKEEC